MLTPRQIVEAWSATLGGTYCFDLARVADGWRITGVVMTATWADGNQNLPALAAARG